MLTRWEMDEDKDRLNVNKDWEMDGDKERLSANKDCMISSTGYNDSLSSSPRFRRLGSNVSA